VYSWIDGSSIASYRVQVREDQWLLVGLFCRGTGQEGEEGGKKVSLAGKKCVKEELKVE